MICDRQNAGGRIVSFLYLSLHWLPARQRMAYTTRWLRHRFQSSRLHHHYSSQPLVRLCSRMDGSCTCSVSRRTGGFESWFCHSVCPEQIFYRINFLGGQGMIQPVCAESAVKHQATQLNPRHHSCLICCNLTPPSLSDLPTSQHQ